MDTHRTNVALFLHPEPPSVESLVDDLFVGRVAELAHAEEKVTSILNGQSSSELIMAVAGLARVGKSHFMLRLLQKVRSQFSLVHRQRVPQGITDPVQVMRQLVRELEVAFEQYVQQHELGTDEKPVLAEFDETCRLYREAIQGREMQLTDRSTVQRATALGAQLKGSGKLGGLLGKLLEVGGEVGASYQRTDGTNQEDGVSVKVSPFDTQDLCDLIALGYDSVRRAQEEKHGLPPFSLLVVMDDFDLLSRLPDGGGFDPLPILRGLYALAQIDGLHVLTTVREDTFDNNDKNFIQVAYVEPFESADYLLEIFGKRVQHFMAGQDPFNDDFVRLAAEFSGGRPGIFLRFLNHAYDRNSGNVKELLFTPYLKRTWERLQRQLPKDFSRDIESAIDVDGGILSAACSKRWRHTSAMQVLYEDYSSAEELTVDPILASYRRNQNGDSTP